MNDGVECTTGLIVGCDDQRLFWTVDIIIRNGMEAFFRVYDLMHFALESIDR